MTTKSPDEVDGRLDQPVTDDAARSNGRLDDALRTIKDAADKLSDRIRLPRSGAQKQNPTSSRS
jgi:hypothetical protein